MCLAQDVDDACDVAVGWRRGGGERANRYKGRCAPDDAARGPVTPSVAAKAKCSVSEPLHLKSHSTDH